MIISIKEGRTFDEVQHLFLMKIQRNGYKGNVPQYNAIYKKPTTNIRVCVENLNAFFLNSTTMQGHPLSLLQFNMEVLVRAVR